MKLRHLETFIAIAEEGTLTAAAVRLFKTQGSVSNDLKALEIELATTLIDRSGQRIKLTPAGRALLPHARDLLARAESTRTSIRHFLDGRASPIHIGVLPSLADRVVSCINLFLGRSGNGTSFVLRTELEDPILAWLEDGSADLGIAEPVLDAGVEAHPLQTENLVVALPIGHSLARETSLTPEQLVDQPFIGFARALGGPSQALHFFSAVGRYPDPVVEVNDHRVMLALIRAGVGLGILPADSVLAEPSIIAVKTNPPLQRQVAILSRPDRPMNSEIARFKDFVAMHWPGLSYD